MKLVRRDFKTRKTLMKALASTVEQRLRSCLSARRRASLAVPGGTTPGPFLLALSEADIDWPQVTVTLTDERWVPVTSDRSNHGLLRDTLFRRRAAASRFVPLFGGGAQPEVGIAHVESALVREVLPLDVCVLGMGTDLHTASLFPDGDTLAEALSKDAPPVLPIRAPGAPEARVTLTAPVLRGAAHIFLLITGAAKAAALDSALADGSLTAAPVRVVLSGSRPVEIFYAP